MSAGKRATCQVCRKLILLRDDGTLRVHRGGALTCGGSGALPVPGGGDDETWIMPDGAIGVQDALFPLAEVGQGGGGRNG